MHKRINNLNVPEDFLISSFQRVEIEHISMVDGKVSALRMNRIASYELSIGAQARKNSNDEGRLFRRHNNLLIMQAALVAGPLPLESQGLPMFFGDKRFQYWFFAVMHLLFLVLLSSVVFSSVVGIFGINLLAAFFASYKYLVTLFALGVASLCSVAALIYAHKHVVRRSTRFVLVFASVGMIIEVAILLRLVLMSFWGHYGV